MKLKTVASAIILFSLGNSIVMADNWGHWRGDKGNGVSLTAHPPTEWSEVKNVQWKAEIPGRGSGSPVVWADRVFVVSAIPEGNGNQSGPLRFELLCFDRATGRKLWQQTATTTTPHEGTHETNSFASASPCTDGEHVYAHFGSRGLYCYTLDGRLVWKRTDFGKMKTRATFGEGSSPALSGDFIIVPWDHEGPSYIAALDKRSGETVWKTEREEPSCWGTPLIVEFQGRQQIICNGQNYARAYDLETGKELWRCAGQTDRPIASAVSTDDRVYVGSGYRGSFLGAFRLGGEGDIQNTKNVVWTIDRDTPDIASLLLSGDRLYFYKAKSGILSCVDARTGEYHYAAKRVPGLSTIYASPVAANGRVYLTGRSGTTVVIKDASTFEVLATNSVGETVDATPALVGNQLFIRGENHLFCIAEE